MNKIKMFESEERRGTFMAPGLLEALKDKYKPMLEAAIKRSPEKRKAIDENLLAVLWENEYAHLRSLGEATVAANMGPYTKQIMPMIGRVVTNLIAPEIVSVQPLLAPIGAIFAKETKYGTSKGSIVKGQNIYQTFDANFQYTSEDVTGELLATGDGNKYGGAGAALNASVSFKPVKPLDTTTGAKVTVFEVTSGGTVVQTATDNGAGGFSGAVAAGAINYATGQISGFLFTNAVGNGNFVKATYAYDQELNDQLPEINLDFTSIPVKAVNRKAKGTLSPEASEDLFALHGMEGAGEVSAELAKFLTFEADRDILADLLKLAVASGTSATYDRAVGANDDNDFSAIRRVLNPLSDVSNVIHEKTGRAPANWIVCNARVWSLLSQLGTHANQTVFQNGNNPHAPPNAIVQPTSYDVASSSNGIKRMQILNSEWMVFVDHLFAANTIMMGLKGSAVHDAGYVWSPYVMASLTQMFLNPGNMTMTQGIRMRAAKTPLRGEFYGKIALNNMTI